jgi:hypothetical protein
VGSRLRRQIARQVVVPAEESICVGWRWTEVAWEQLNGLPKASDAISGNPAGQIRRAFTELWPSRVDAPERRSVGLRGAAFVAMVKAADLWNRDDATSGRWRDGPRGGRVLVQRQMRP